MKNKDPLSQDLKVLMQFSDDEFVADIFKEEEQPGKRFKSAKFVGVIDNFRKSLTDARRDARRHEDALHPLRQAERGEGAAHLRRRR